MWPFRSKPKWDPCCNVPERRPPVNSNIRICENDPGDCICRRCAGLRAGTITPWTFAEYMVTPRKIEQRKAMIAMMDLYDKRAKWTNEQWRDFFADRLGF